MDRLELDVMMIRIHAMMSTGRYADARRLLEAVLEAEPSHGIAHGMMGWICWSLLDENERALTHFRCAVRWAPDCVNSWMHYLNLLAAEDREDELHEAFGRALVVPGIDRSAVRSIIARYLERTGRAALALVYYREALRAATTAAAEHEHREHIRRLRRRLRRERWAF